jgi:hypothetical protein
VTVLFTVGMRRVPLLLLVFAFGCGKKSEGGGLPPASEWNSGSAEILDPGSNSFSGSAVVPEAPDDDIHNRLGQQQPSDDTQPGEEPDPHKVAGPVDPNVRVKGVLVLDAKVKSRVAAGGIIFLAVKKLGPDGVPLKSPLAVDRIEWKDAGATFDLTDKIGGDASGDLVVTAHYDQDGDASSTQIGDVLGQAKIKVPADNVKLVLDTVATQASP